MPASSVFDLPPYRVGPYVVRVVPGGAAAIEHKTRHARFVYGTSEPSVIREGLPAEKQLELFIRLMLQTIHYRSGLNPKSDEESFTHSAATGIVEIAHNSPEFWAQFNQHLGDRLGQGRRGWALRAMGLGVEPVQPKRVVFPDEVFTFAQIPDSATYWAWCDFTNRRIELSSSLAGVNLCTILLHECLHAVHWCNGADRLASVRKRSVDPFIRAQASGLLHFWRDNPRFWSWWLYTLATAKDAAALAPGWPERGRA